MQLCKHLVVEKAAGETKGFRCQYLGHYIGADVDYWCTSCSHYCSEDELETERMGLELVGKRSEVGGGSLAGICRLCRFRSGCKKKGKGCELFTL